ncbi:branched-chain amino acid ABC transporter permease [Campylobacter coli]|nr:branched-chain amino acid ABC transporter permease [Campylobacter coli]
MKQRELFLLTIPVLMGYIPLGAAFGILAASKDFSLFEILLSSNFIYAGAGQFLLVALVAQNVSFLMIFFTLFLLNFRHFFYTLSLLKELKSINFLRHYIIFALTDESFALLSSIKEKIKNLSRAQRSLIMFEVCLLNQIYWVIGSVLGYYFKQGLNIDYSGVEFSLNALFIVLAYELYKQNPNLKILLYSSFVALFALFCIDKPYMLAFCIFIALMILIFGKKYVR